MAVVVVLLLFVVIPIALVLYELGRRRRCSTLPPGPASLPFLGNVLEFTGDSRPKHEIIAQLSEKYGDLMTLWFLTKPVIILSSVEAVRQAYIDRSDISDRPDTLVATLLFDGKDNDIAFGHYTPRWQQKRKLFHQTIRTLVGTKRLEQETIAVVEQVISKMLDEGPGKPIDIQMYIIKALYNMIMLLAYGKRFDLDDPEFLRFCKTHNIDTEAINASRFYDMFPFLQYLPLFHLSPSMKRMKELLQVYRGYIMKWYYEAKAETGGDEIEYMTQALVKGVDAADAKAAQGDDTKYGDEEIMHMLMDLYLGATSTSSAAMSWILLEMTRRPDIQERCYKEIMEVTNGRPVSLADRHHLPYVEACILEVLRHYSPVSLCVPHSPVMDIQLRDYHIPKGTETILNIYALHHDPKLWKDALNFNPENFLDDRGHLDRPPHMFTFGAGRRTCPGEMFAKNSIFLMFTGMLQRVRLEKVDGFDYGSQLAEVSGEFLLVPKKYYVQLKPREN